MSGWFIFTSYELQGIFTGPQALYKMPENQLNVSLLSLTFLGGSSLTYLNTLFRGGGGGNNTL